MFHGFEIHPTIHGWTGKVDEYGHHETIAIIRKDGEAERILYIDGDGGFDL